MKKFITIFSILCVAFIATFATPAFANQTDITTNYNESNVENMEVEDALHCKTTFADGTSAECWFCKCPITQPPAPVGPAPAE